MADISFPDGIDTRDLDVMSGAVYFVVGRGTEGGMASYRLSIAGVTVGTREPRWGDVSAVAQDSGYSIGAIQVDFGKRGQWPVGASSQRPLRAGEQSYVEAVIGQASAYAGRHGLPFASDHRALRQALLSHGNGRGGRRSLVYIDSQTRDAINAWAGSDQGRRWIHANVDWPQVRQATRIAMQIVQTHGSHVGEAQRFPAISLLAKTANQLPSQLARLEKVLANGGDYAALRAESNAIHLRYRHYAGGSAADLAERYQSTYRRQPLAFDRAHRHVSRADFDPVTGHRDADIRLALRAVGVPAEGSGGSRVLAEGAAGADVLQLERNLLVLGYLPVHGAPALPDRQLDARTRRAIEAFQGAHGLVTDGRAGPRTLAVIEREARALQVLLSAAGALDVSGRVLQVDGVLGHRSRQALRAFQRAHDLEASGVMDAPTTACLNYVGRYATTRDTGEMGAVAGQGVVANVHPQAGSEQAASEDPLHKGIRDALAAAWRQHGLPWSRTGDVLAERLLRAAVTAGFDASDTVQASLHRPRIFGGGAQVMLQRIGKGASADPAANRVHMPAGEALGIGASGFLESGGPFGRSSSMRGDTSGLQCPVEADGAEPPCVRPHAPRI